MVKIINIIAAVLIMFSISPVYVLADTGVLVKVVDGDTLKLKVNGTIANYRLAGVDTPETYNNRKAKKDIVLCNVSNEVMFELGTIAKDFVKSEYSPGDTVKYTVVDVGRYGRPIILIRPLAYSLVVYGYARVVDYGNLEPSVLRHLYSLEWVAKSGRRGIWATLPCWGNPGNIN